MKKTHLAFACLVLAVGFTACGNNSGSTTTTTTDSSTNTNASTATTPATNDTANSSNASSMNATSKTPLNKEDSTFVMKAAMGGMMEVQGGQTAQQNAQNDRVKNFGQMMVTDHGQANQELMSLVSNKGMNIPNTLPADKQKMLDQMKNTKGTAFDKHYMGMMLSDHKKDVAEFKEEANKAKDPDLKAWVNKTLPVLQRHLDSAQAINGNIK